MKLRRWIRIMAWLAALALTPTASVAADLTSHEKELYEAARQEGEVTWYVGYYSAEVSEIIGQRFTQRYPGVRVNVVRTTTQVAFQRLSQDIRSSVHICDVLTTNDPGHYEHLKSENLLLKYEPRNAATVVDALKGMDKDGYYFAIGAGLVMIAYNSDRVTAEEAPKSWRDLLDPRWKDQVALGHPGYSGYAATWAIQMRKDYGWEYFEELEENNPLIGRSIIDTVTMLNSGERLVAAAPSATAIRSLERGNPIGLVYPEDGSILMLSPSAILSTAPHPNAAKLFMEFLLSEENSRIQVETGGHSVHASVAPSPAAKPLEEVETIRPEHDEIVDGIPEVKVLWRDLFGI